MFAHELQRLVNVLMRRYNIWLTVAHQNMSQFAYSESLQNLLLSLKTQLIGTVDLLDDALLLARRLFTVDPEKVKRTEGRYDTYTKPISVYREQRVRELIDIHETDYPMHEQYYKWAQSLMNLKTFLFLLHTPTYTGVPMAGILISK
ncbi:MAG: hypothetical protein IPO81_22985 [Kouleothrix sp.]|nr:hypothetical protein [Kouleothrix sp.]